MFILPSLLLSLFLVAYPLYVIRPFRSQGRTELALALAVLLHRPLLMALAVLVSLAALVWYWGRERRPFRRAISAGALLVVAGLALLSRVNVFEMMFRPLDRASFSE